MPFKKAAFHITIFILAVPAFAQVTNRENYDLKPQKKKEECSEMLGVLNQIPAELRLNSTINGDSIYVHFPSAVWFARIFESKGDGIAIDLAQKQQYQCDNISRLATSWSHKGYLMPPVYRDDLKRIMRVRNDGYVLVPIGKLPSSIKPENAEPNYVLINDRTLCGYGSIVNIDFHGWTFLKTGMYYDTLSQDKLLEKYKELSKRLQFTIPFEKNKATYNPQDLQPMHDSLRMTDFAIKTISIRAFTSVEGTYERNEALQAERARSIVDALQSFQNEKIESTILTSENWVEFLDDVGSFQPDLIQLSKDEVKERLKSPALLAKLEPMLKSHRKGIIEVTLEKRLSYRESNPDELKKYFHQTIIQKNIDEALYLQQIIFNKIERKEIPETYLDELEVPEALDYGSLLVNSSSFEYEHGASTVFEAMETFTRLDQLLPNNAHIRYNLCVLRLDALRYTELLDDQIPLKKEIEGLTAKGIHPALVRRLLINYHILLSEKYERKQQFDLKNKMLKYIMDAYKALPLTDSDLLNLAKYYSHYSRFDWAESVIEPRMKALDVSEDLLFYYVSLTIIHPQNTKESSYRSILLNAINSNRQRLCTLFNASGNGGVSFQLLNDPFLKKTYCENCKKPAD